MIRFPIRIPGFVNLPVYKGKKVVCYYTVSRSYAKRYAKMLRRKLRVPGKKRVKQATPGI